MKTFVRILLGIDALAALVVVYFFFVGLADGSVSSFNGALWFALLAGVAAIVGGGWALQSSGRRGLAAAVLLILALPAVAYALFIALIVVTQPRWN
ncbi:MAG: osmoprotectant transporter permease [Proteobacteria bacterium]|nr:osmoprotectant transporter permease [Pseudomonadota bacterium]